MDIFFNDFAILFFASGYSVTAIIKIERLLNTIIDGQRITMCHYCMRVWHLSHYNSWHVFGHSHGRLEAIGKSFDVGVDCNNFKPISWEELKIIMNKRPDNFNLKKGD